MVETGRGASGPALRLVSDPRVVTRLEPSHCVPDRVTRPDIRTADELDRERDSSRPRAYGRE